MKCDKCGGELVQGCGLEMHVDPWRFGCEGEPIDFSKPLDDHLAHVNAVIGNANRLIVVGSRADKSETDPEPIWAA